ncbi:hypothetical protein NXS19_001226 [Fusarium pseudograminearum]|nr:hypothetical protein NXS19_001226 [Fusarium pseudograminearum]
MCCGCSDHHDGCMQLWLWPTYQDTGHKRQNNITQAILYCPDLLQTHHEPGQDLNAPPLPPHLRPQMVPQVLLYPHGSCHLLHDSLSNPVYPAMLSHQRRLGQVDAPTCIDLEKFWLANAGFSIATDTLILMLPMHPICTSKLSVAQKRGLIMLLATGGGLVITTSIVRTTTLSFTAKTPDTTFNISSTMWSIIEQNLAIICTCLPMCRLPIATRFPLWVSESELTAPDVSQPADPSKRQTRRWSPYTGPRNVQGITRSIVITSDEMSDELTLDPVERTFTMSTLSSDIGAIRKIVEYEITFETASEAEP